MDVFWVYLVFCGCHWIFKIGLSLFLYSSTIENSYFMISICVKASKVTALLYFNEGIEIVFIFLFDIQSEKPISLSGSNSRRTLCCNFILRWNGARCFGGIYDGLEIGRI